MRRLLIAAAFIAAAGSQLLASPGPEAEGDGARGLDAVSRRAEAVPASAEFPALVGVERKLSFDVSKYIAPDGKRWIRLVSAYDSVCRASMDDIIAALWDFESSPEIFSRIEATRLRSLSDDGTVAVTEQRTGVRVLGFAYISNLVFRNELRRDGQSAAIDFEAIEVDQTTLSSKGSWTLVESRDASGPLTYVRYFLDSCVEPKYPAQEWIMRNFGDGDMRRIIRELSKAVARNHKTG